MSQKTRIVIIGNGFGGVYTLRNFHKFFHRRKDVHLTMIGEKNYFLFTPLLHEVATGSINPENIIEPIREVLGCCIDQFYLGKAEKVNIEDKTVSVGGCVAPYDFLVVASGAETNFYNIPGAKEYSLALKSIEDAIKIKNHIISQMERASYTKDSILRKKMLSFVIVGGGPTGVELATELYELIKNSFSHYYKKELIEDAFISLIQKDKELLPQFSPKVRGKSLEVLTKKGINVMLGTEVVEVGASHLSLGSGKRIETESIFWVAGIKPKEINFDQEVSKLKDGRLIVNKYLELEGHKDIFALGDNAAFRVGETDNFLPGLAQVAEKEAVSVAENIYLSVRNKELKPFKYRHTGSMISLGQWMAIGEVSGFVFLGRITWWIWRTLYLSKFISSRKKIKVAIDWTINLFSPRDISEL